MPDWQIFGQHVAKSWKYIAGAVWNRVGFDDTLSLGVVKAGISQDKNHFVFFVVYQVTVAILC